MTRQVCIVGGSPQLNIDAVRYVTSRSTGATARKLSRILTDLDVPCSLVLNSAVAGDTHVAVYRTRIELEDILHQKISEDPDQCIVMSAALNDFQPVQVSQHHHGDEPQVVDSKVKISSQVDAFTVRFERASKLIDALSAMGHRGPLVGFKFEDKDTLLDSAEGLLHRVHADYVLANSMCMTVQALLSVDGVELFESRQQILTSLAEKLACI